MSVAHPEHSLILPQSLTRTDRVLPTLFNKMTVVQTLLPSIV